MRICAEQEAKAKERVTTFGRVAAGLAHDLRLPVETLGDATRAHLEAPDDPNTTEYFQWSVNSELPKLKSYLDDLQHLASEGSILLELSRVDLLEIASEVCAEHGKRGKWQGIDFVAEGKAPMLDADEQLLRRALSNLAGNAADAAIGREAPRVTISVGTDGTFHTLTVSDNGKGMDAELLEQVLAGDFRSTKKSNGIGLGFGVARHIAQSHGGRIEGESEVGVGTAITLTVRSKLTEGDVLSDESDETLVEAS